MHTVWRAFIKPVKFFYKLFINLFSIEWSEDKWLIFEQFVKFASVGLSNTFISYLINVLVLRMMISSNASWDFYLANIVAFLLSVLWSFYWNNKYVFVTSEVNKRSICKTLLKTYSAYAFTGLILANFLSWVWIDLYNFSKYIAPLINLIISVPVNFLLNKLWAFKV